MSRCLLRKSRLDGFKEWLTSEGIEHRAGRGDYQVLQVKTESGWQCIYDRLDAKVHFTTPDQLEGVIRRFIASGRKGAA